MKKIFSTADVCPRDRFERWHEVTRQYVVDHDSRPDCRWSFEATLSRAMLEELPVLTFESSPFTVLHTDRHAARACDEFIVCRQLGGVMALEQAGRQVSLHNGDLTLLDARVPYVARLSDGASALLLKVPRRRLAARVGRTGEMIARLMRPQDGENGLVSEFLGLLPRHVDKLSKAASGVVAEQALDLLALAVAGCTSAAQPRVSSARFVVQTRVRSAIERRLGDPDLTPAAVAAAVGVSVRYANAVLADKNTSVYRLIQTLRLERCRQALADPTQSHRTVSDIAYSWGFSDMTHFGRRFRVAFGLLPSEFRRSRQPQEPA
jgi:AraC family transcriptional regulator, positive regulator of tynA and feaB